MFETSESIWLSVIGSLLIIVGATGLMNHTRKGQTWVRLLGPVGSRLFYVVIGVLVLIYGLFMV
jgi:hypothetical protein